MNTRITLILLSTSIAANAIKLSRSSENDLMAGNWQLATDAEVEGNCDKKCECAKQPLEPTECGANDRFTHDEMREALKEFKDVWARLPKSGKLGFNHHFAEWFLVKSLKPSVVVESGVLHGESTAGLREAAGPNARIFSFDPVDQTKLGFRDQNPNTTYLTNGNWKDLTIIDWESLGVSAEDRANAVVILDDHQIFYDRFDSLKKLGFRHVFIEDNNHYGNGNTSPNFFCTKAELYKHQYPEWVCKDCAVYKNSLTKSATKANNSPNERHISWDEHKENQKYIQNNLVHYFEFPAVYDNCEKRPSLLKADELREHGLPANSGLDLYKHRYPPYVEIRQ